MTALIITTMLVAYWVIGAGLVGIMERITDSNDDPDESLWIVLVWPLVLAVVLFLFISCALIEFIKTVGKPQPPKE